MILKLTLVIVILALGIQIYLITNQQPSVQSTQVQPNSDQQANVNPKLKQKPRHHELHQQDIEQSVLQIFHFNDVYDIQPDIEEPKGGVAFFKSLLDRYRKQYQKGDNILTFFSGDCFSPALLSNEYKGRNMIKPLNALRIDLACIGNHDLDYPLAHVMQLHKATNFEWLLGNIINIKTGRRLAEGLQYKIIEKNGVKIGLFSLAQEQWIDTLKPYYHEISEYIPYVQFAQYMVQLLKDQLKCDIIIALTHMMKYNDVKLAEEVPEIDLILGGHDHIVYFKQIGKTAIVKSGSNFQTFSIVTVIRKGCGTSRVVGDHQKILRFEDNQHWIFQVKLVQVHHQNEKISPDFQLHSYVNDIYSKFAANLAAVAVYTRHQVDLTFKHIRRNQSPFLYILTSFFMHTMKAECAVFNNGIFRADKLIQPGPITLGILSNLIQEQLVVKLIPGKDLLLALQKMLSLYPGLSGRFSSVSGISFIWNSTAQPNQRVIKETVLINDEPIQQQRIYKVCLSSYMAGGGDGFNSFKAHPILRDETLFTNVVGLARKLRNVQDEDVKNFVAKYPSWFEIKQVDGKKYLQVLLNETINVKRL